MARLAFLMWLVLPSGMMLAAGASGGAAGCLPHGSGTTAASSSATSHVPMVTIHPRHIVSHAFARRFVIPSYIVGGFGYGGLGYGGLGYGSGMGGYNNGWGTSVGSASSDSSNTGPNIFAPANAAQRPQPAANGNLAPAAPADPPAELPSRNWTILNDEAGDKTVEARYAGVLDGQVVLRKSDGHIMLVALDKLSLPDRDYVAEQTGHKAG